MDNELISVVIPTHGRTQTLERALKSVKKQTYKNIEIIVIDDNSEDEESRQKVKEIVNKFDDINIFFNKKNLGGSRSRNEGIKYANGDFIAFLDDDDEFFSEKLEKQMKLYKELNNPKIGMIYCYANYIYEDTNKIITRKVDNEGIPLVEHLKICVAATSWWFCPKKVLEDIGGFADVSSHQDAITLFRMLCKGYEIYRVPEVLLNYFVHIGNGITKVSNEWIDIDRKYMEEYKAKRLDLSKKDEKEIDYCFYKRFASYDYRLKNYTNLKNDVCKMIKIKLFNKDTLKAICKLILLKVGR